MKKTTMSMFFDSEKLRKINLKMKLTTLFLLVSLLKIQANTYSQNTKISLDLENTSIQNVFNTIESSSDFRFLYNHLKVDLDRKVSIHVKKERISDILKSLFADTDVYFTVKKKLIILKTSKKKEDKEVIVATPFQQSVTGKITDANGVPLPGASILVKGTTNGTQTDFDGNFSLNITTENAILVISYIGYTTKEIPVNNQTSITVSLEENTAELDEVVVVGYGTQKKVNLTGSVVTVSEEDFENRNVSNPVQALQGRVAGLRVTQTTGAPGNEDVTFQLRGVNSFSSDSNISSVDKNKPLVLINGLVGNMNDLDPAFIESVTVLKDAASASIYGARAANGVILVTTKKGAADKTSITYTGRIMNQSMINQLDRDWNSVNFMEKVNAWLAPYTGRYYSDEVINNFRNNPNSDEFPNFNHEDFYLKNVTINSHSLQIGGTSGKTRYNVGVGHWDQDGIAAGFTFKKTNVLVNLESEVTDYFKVGAFVNGTVSKRTEPYNGERDYLMGILSQSPTYKPWLLDGSGRYTGSNNGSLPESVGYADVSSKNAYAISNNPNALTYDDRLAINANAFADIKLLDGLNWYTKFGADITQTDYKNRRPVLRMYSYRSGEFQGNMDNIGDEQLIHRVGKREHYTIFSHLNYQKTINEDHNFGLMVGLSQETDKYETIEGIRRGFASPNLDVLSGAPSAGQTNAGNIEEFTLRSFFGRFTYNYKSKYLIEANFRRDGSSRFHKDNRYGVFPSFSAGWNISKEDFLSDVDWLSNLKLRASYGQMGNDLVGLYPYQSVLALGKDYPFSNLLQGGALREALSNPNIRWEETEITDIGFDLAMFNNRFTMTFDYYDKTTDGILRVAQLPLSSGLLAPFVNEGVVNNKGFEIVTGYQNTINDFSYGINFNISAYKNKLVKFGARTFDLNAMIEGKEINRYFMYQADGIYQSQAEIDNGPTPRWPAAPGDIRLKDIDGDGAITPDDRIDVDGVNPDFFYGFDLTAKYKNWDFSAFFQGEQGRKVLVNNEWSLILPFTVHGANPITWWDDAWTPENPSTTKPRAIAYSAPEGQSIREATTFWLRDASYLRLKNLNIGYTLPSELMDKIFLDKVRLFVNAENLLTFSDFEFGDPERPGDNLYPMFRTLTAGATIKF
ncbi:TonB-dependent receptor [Snuella lapsa]|uniref:TonB-dependent receptor n=1 Tax=Snuella lapsa TaxID=870481 RepID=A0ABP6Y3R3_9FLAO